MLTSELAVSITSLEGLTTELGMTAMNEQNSRRYMAMRKAEAISLMELPEDAKSGPRSQSREQVWVASRGELLNVDWGVKSVSSQSKSLPSTIFRCRY